MQKRELFPKVMFVLAGASFVFGIFEYFQASALQSATQKRMAFIMTSIEKSSIGTSQKKELYATITEGLPPIAGIFMIDVSGSFASTESQDFCANDGQRSICQALKDTNTDAGVLTAICGACNPH